MTARLALSAALLTALAVPAGATDWTCRNELAEISCADGACEMAESFTPLSLSFAEGKGARPGIEVCAYSGCWSGGTSIRINSDGIVILTSKDLTRDGEEEADWSAALIFDREDRVAILRAADFTVPMTCEAVEP